MIIGNNSLSNNNNCISLVCRYLSILLSGTCSLQKSQNDCILRALNVALAEEHYSW